MIRIKDILKEEKIPSIKNKKYDHINSTKLN